MALYRINDFDPQYQNQAGSDRLDNFDVYTDRNERIGRVVDALLDQTGNFRYLVVDLGSWLSGKQVLVPVGRSEVDSRARRIYVSGLSRAQAADLPAYHSSTPVDTQYEQQVRTVYRTRLLEESAPLESSAALEGPRVVRRAPATPAPPVQPTVPAASQPDPDLYAYQQDPDLYELNERRHQPFLDYQERLRATRRQPTAPGPVPDQRVVSQETIPLREERLIVDRQRRKVGEVVVRKEIQTEIIEVPVQREKLIVEEVGAEPKQLAEIDLHDSLDAESIHPDDLRDSRSHRRSPRNPL